jgi:hypothetical protein
MLIHRDLNKDKDKEEFVNDEVQIKRDETLSKIKLLIAKIDILKYTLDVIQKDGVLSLYNGVTSSLIGSIIQNGVFFCSTKFWKYVFEHLNKKTDKLLNSILINLLAALVTTFVTNPVWVLNVRMTNRSAEVY